MANLSDLLGYFIIIIILFRGKSQKKKNKNSISDAALI